MLLWLFFPDIGLIGSFEPQHLKVGVHCICKELKLVGWLVGFEFNSSVNTINPCPAEPGYTLSLQIV